MEKWDIDAGESCPLCGGVLLYRIFDIKGGGEKCTAYCNDCDYKKDVVKAKNVKKRTNTSLEHWAWRVKKYYNFRCAICGSDNEVEAHHIIPVAACRKEEPSLTTEDKNGIALCKKHHMMVHTAPTTQATYALMQELSKTHKELAALQKQVAEKRNNEDVPHWPWEINFQNSP